MAVPRFRITERQVLLVILAASILGLAGAFLVAGFGRQRGERLEAGGAPRVRWMPQAPVTPASDAQYVLAEYFDPSLMSLPSPRGFSSRLWQRGPAATPRTFEPAAELALIEPAPAAELPALLGQPGLNDAVQGALQKLGAVADDNEPLAPVEAAMASTQSAMRVEGNVASRRVLSRPELPVVRSDASLRPSRVRVAVAPDGRVRYVAIERSCGNEGIDAQALETARQIRFEPVTTADPLELSWGIVRFFWVPNGAKPAADRN